MKTLFAAAALLCAAAFAHARPVIIEETSSFQYSDPTFSFGAVATDGEYAVVLGLHNFINDGYSDTESTAFLFHRTGTSWSFVRRLGSGYDSGVDDMHGHYGVAIQNGVIALAILPLQIFELRNGDWVQAPVYAAPN